MKITWLGHSAFRVEIGESIILFDPFLTGNPKFHRAFSRIRARRDAYSAHPRA